MSTRSTTAVPSVTVVPGAARSYDDFRAAAGSTESSSSRNRSWNATRGPPTAGMCRIGGSSLGGSACDLDNNGAWPPPNKSRPPSSPGNIRRPFPTRRAAIATLTREPNPVFFFELRNSNHSANPANGKIKTVEFYYPDRTYE